MKKQALFFICAVLYNCLLLANYSPIVIQNGGSVGNLIDSNRASGDVIVKNGIEYEIEASGTVTLNDGFKVEKGAIFAVYPSCF